jgi:prepilin-type N-terminal cleavage/methylation domain-containing protein
MSARARRLAREEDGFSLIELLTALALGSVVLTALMFVFTTGLTASGRVTDRVDSTARARLAMDRMTTLLNSQVCLVNPDATSGQVATPPVVPASDGNAVTFYADLDGASDTPNKYTITYNPTAKTLTLASYAGIGQMATGITFPSTPSSTTLLADNVQGALNSGGTEDPVFSYYAFTASGTVDETAPLVTPISIADSVKVVRVGVKFQANSTRTKTDDRRRTIIIGQGIVATADPVDQSTCP